MEEEALFLGYNNGWRHRLDSYSYQWFTSILLYINSVKCDPLPLLTRSYKFNFKVILASDQPSVNLSTGKREKYKKFSKIPCFIFVRDTISYLILLGLHLALSVESSQLSLSVLEWAILVLFAGRLLIEMKQMIHFARKPSEHQISGFSLFKAKLSNFILTYLRYE